MSNFTIKLLEQGFDLHGHLLALRRYHFMELADWADSFILSLRNQVFPSFIYDFIMWLMTNSCSLIFWNDSFWQKWYGIEPEQKITEIQGQLDLALRRSSCENDQYRERLFLFMKGKNLTARPHSTTGKNCIMIFALLNFLFLLYDMRKSFIYGNPILWLTIWNARHPLVWFSSTWIQSGLACQCCYNSRGIGNICWDIQLSHSNQACCFFIGWCLVQLKGV